MPHLKLRDGAELYYERHGSGPALFMVPGLGGDSRFWDAHVPELSRHFTVVLHDHRGTARSSLSKIEYSVEQMADDALQLIDTAMQTDQAPPPAVLALDDLVLRSIALLLVPDPQQQGAPAEQQQQGGPHQPTGQKVAELPDQGVDRLQHRGHRHHQQQPDSEPEPSRWFHAGRMAAMSSAQAGARRQAAPTRQIGRAHV